jgi:hypothetical protein
LQPVPFPSAARLVSPITQADFDGDGQMERVTLADGQASLWSATLLRWQSPAGWQVHQAQIADLNRDGLPELVLLVWRPFRSWPVDKWLPSKGRIASFQDANGSSCQIILIGWFQNSFRERWAGSALAQPVKSFAAADLLGNGKPYLVTLESEYNDPASQTARRLKVWEWNGFGFTSVYIMPAPFRQVLIFAPREPQPGQSIMLAP